MKINGNLTHWLKDATFGEFVEVFKRYEYIKVDEETGCWLWQRRLNDKGYAEFGRGGVFGKTKRAHKIFYEKKYGPIPDGLEAAHTCHVRRCVNPDHIYPSTHKENCNVVYS